jgi:hypothetical protein
MIHYLKRVQRWFLNMRQRYKQHRQTQKNRHRRERRQQLILVPTDASPIKRGHDGGVTESEYLDL